MDFIRISFYLFSAILFASCSSEKNNIHWSELPLTRIEKNPIIYPDMPGLEGELGANINGPSVIKVPDWFPNPLGKYYMYFAHHQGQYIRLAYADHPNGPWKIYKPGVLKLEETACVGHIASPDIIIEESTKTIRMYFHGPTPNRGEQKSFLAISKDGIDFSANEEQLGLPYFRVFKYKDYYYAIGKKGAETGILYRSVDGLKSFEEGPSIIPRMRHAALSLDENQLYIYYSRIGDEPERILFSTVDLNNESWLNWNASKPKEVIRPMMDYEGADLPVFVSNRGAARELVHQLRDPALLIDETGSYLYYSVAGEFGIAIAKFDNTHNNR